MDFLRRHWLDLAAAPFLIWLQWRLAQRLAPRWPRAAPAAGVSAMGLLFITLLLSLPFTSSRLPYSPALEWVKAAGLTLAICSAGAWAIDLVWRALARLAPVTVHDPGRRQILNAGRAAAMAMPLAVTGYGAFIERSNFRLVESRIRVPGLAKDLDGLRIAQITDIHFGTFFTARDLRYSIDLANDTKPHLALVTGDLISVHSDPLDECLTLLRGLRAEAGVLGCLGNHEIVAGCEDYTEMRGAEGGLRFLRNKKTVLRFGAAELNVAGVDYQRKGRPYLTQTAALRDPARFNLLLSHNPDVFPVAAAQGWDLTAAGHTHGGQMTVEILGVAANVARFYTPYIYGRYEKEGRQIYVSRGLGTVGIPSRVGAPPEVSLVTLCAT